MIKNSFDFLDLVVVGFGLILLGIITAAYFTSMPLDPDIKEWFFAILTFLIGKKALPQTMGK